MEKYNLVIVDMQYDFYDPNGSMYVSGAKGLLEDMVAYIEQNHEKLTGVIFTLDWHPINHCSFKEQNGPWPMHCVQYTKGASLPTELLNVCQKHKLPMQFVTKGETCEEYGAFGNNPCLKVSGELMFAYLGFIRVASPNFLVCGIAGDYCVLETIKNLRKINDDYIKPTEPNLIIKAIPHLIASIDGGATFYEYADNTELPLINEL